MSAPQSAQLPGYLVVMMRTITSPPDSICGVIRRREG